MSSEEGWAEVVLPFTVQPPGGTGPGEITLVLDENASVHERSAELTVGGNVFLITQAGMVPEYALSQEALSADASGDALTLTLTAVPADAPWEIAELPDWVSVSQASGTGSAELTFTFGENASVSDRSAAISIAAEELSLEQAGMVPEYALSQESLSAGAAGGALGVTLTAVPPDAPWQVANLPDWISISQAGGTGSAELTFTFAENASVSSRSAAVAVAGQTLSLEQAGMVPEYALSQEAVTIGFAGGELAIDLTATPSDAPWQVLDVPDWLMLTSASSGTGSTAVRFEVPENPSQSERSAQIGIAGLELLVLQHGAPPPSIFEDSEGTIDLGEGWKANALGYWYDAFFPIVYAFAIGDWLYIVGESEEIYYFWAMTEGFWGYTGASLYPFYLALTGARAGEWVEIALDDGGE